MTRDEATEYLIDISYKFGNISVEYLTEKDGEKMREAINVLTNEQQTCEDAISRKDTLAKFKKIYFDNKTVIRCAELVIGGMPSVQPEQEPCEDCISREDALMALTGEWTEPTDELIHRFIRRIKNLPPVNPQPICEEREKGECPYYAG